MIALPALTALPWLKIVKYGAIILLGMFIGSQMQDRLVARPAIKGLRAQLSLAQHDLGVCHAGQATLQSSLDRQNAAVTALEARTEAMREEQALALAEAADDVAEARSRAERIRAAVPEAGATDCDAAGTLASQILFGEAL